MQGLGRLYKYLLLSMLLLTACSGEQRRSIGGVDGQFCIPPERRVSGIWWIPEDPPDSPAGFTFTGCSQKDISGGNCPVPAAVISVNAESLRASGNLDWATVKHSAAFGLLASSSDVIYKVEPRTGYIMVSAAKFSEWFIFQRDWPGSLSEVLALEDADLFMGYCERAIEFPGALTHPKREDYACNRRVRGPKYAISYSFVSPDPVPVNLNELDAAVF